MSENIHWVYVSREDFPSRVLAHDVLKAYGDSYLSPDLVHAKGLAIGYRAFEPFQSLGSDPVLIVVDESHSADIFSWIDVYAEDVFPISQFARVIGVRDWIALDAQRNRAVSDIRLSVWASVVLGEILAQGDFAEDLLALPLSRTTATFSATVAKCLQSHGEMVAMGQCTDRLKAIEGDRRFLRRPVSVEALRSIWHLAAESQSSEGARIDPFSIVDSLWVSIRNFGEGFARFVPEGYSPVHKYPELLSNSIEARVMAFRQMEAAVANGLMVDRPSQSAAVILACGAFLVGRGTSHYFLLENASRKFPEALAWFGLLCGLLGREGWDSQWRKATTGVAKQLRGGFDWDEQSVADLTWIEYNWLTKARGPSNSFESVPKLNPRLLLVEVIPGVNCQFRFAGSDAFDAPSAAARPMSEASRIDLLQAIDLLQITSQKLLKIAGTTSVPHTKGSQVELPLDTPQTRVVSPRRKKTKGGEY